MTQRLNPLRQVGLVVLDYLPGNTGDIRWLLGKHIDNREPVAYSIIGLHFCCMADGRQPVNGMYTCLSAHQLLNRLLALQHTNDRLGHGRAAILRGNVGIIRIGCLKGVHDNPVLPGGDLSVNNVKPLGRHRAGHFRKNSRGEVVVGNHCVLAHAQFLVEATPMHQQ